MKTCWHSAAAMMVPLQTMKHLSLQRTWCVFQNVRSLR